MAKNKSKSILEAELLEKSEEDLRAFALAQYERQRGLRDEKKNDPKIAEHAEYVKGQYSEPASEAEKQIKLVRRVFKLRGIVFSLGDGHGG